MKSPLVIGLVAVSVLGVGSAALAVNLGALSSFQTGTLSNTTGVLEPTSVATGTPTAQPTETPEPAETEQPEPERTAPPTVPVAPHSSDPGEPTPTPTPTPTHSHHGDDGGGGGDDGGSGGSGSDD